MTSQLAIRIERESAEGVVSPELAATWSRLYIEVEGRVVTAVMTRERTYQEALYVSSYPLAEWMVVNWWSLFNEPHPSGLSSSWAAASPDSWHQRHNLRAANSGMVWPDLALSAEGDLIKAEWWTWDAGLIGRGLRFVSEGSALLSKKDVQYAFEDFIESVVQQLLAADVSDSLLQREWEVLRNLSKEELPFAAAAGRLGVDPFTPDDRLAEALEEVLEAFDPELLEELLDTAFPSASSLQAARQWVEAAMRQHTVGHSIKRHLKLNDLDEVHIDARRPWLAGFEAARQARQLLDLDSSMESTAEPFAVETLAYWHRGTGPSGGVKTLTNRHEDALHIIDAQSDFASSKEWSRFTTARSVGLHVLAPTRSTFILSDATLPLQQASRSFAAELLAPGSQVVEMVARLGGPSLRAFDAIGFRLKVDARVIQNQYANRL